jgi:hypothetical protein
MMPPFLLDQDECTIYGTCSQTCRNTNGSYACSCVEGYVMQPDNRSCTAKNGKLWHFPPSAEFLIPFCNVFSLEMWYNIMDFKDKDFLSF